MTAASLAAVDANRLTYLDENDPFYPNVDFPRLTTPQWIGEPGVEAVVILAIDDLHEPAKYETVLRPILNRLKQIDGRAPVSIFCNSLDARHPQFQAWLQEGLSLEVHTLNHHCPLLAKTNFAAAEKEVLASLELLDAIPGNQAVAFRMPCCDSINSPSPRFYAEIFNRTNAAGHFLLADSSVMNLTTSGDASLPRELVLDQAGRERFARYLPFPAFATTIRDYPYPYVIGELCWEFPPMVPSDWEAQHVQGTNNPATVADWKAALDATVRKQGTFTMIFHPHGWIRPDQLVELIDYATGKYGRAVKFLNFHEACDRLTQNLLAGEPLRAANGQDNGVRLIDLNHDGFLDVIVANERTRRTRLWEPATRRWRETDFPVALTEPDPDGSRRATGVRFGLVHADGYPTALLRNEARSGAWHFDGTSWRADQSLLAGLTLGGQPIQTSLQGRDRGVRLRDVNRDGVCELVVGNPEQNAVFGWSPEERTWKQLGFALPTGTAIVDAAGQDNGLRFVDVNEDGYPDVLCSNDKTFGLYLFVPEAFLGFQLGWSREVLTGRRGESGDIPAIVRGGPRPNNGAWVHARQLWVQNEDTERLPDLVDRRSFDELVAGLKPPALSPSASLAAIQVRPGFRVELVAHEPLVKSPVAFDWGADGKLWVVEMGDYPLGVDNQGKAGGVVRFLEDTDGDGRYDRSTVFLDGLNFPNGLIAWGRGVIVSAPPEIFYAEDTDGDGKADVRRTLFSGFVEGNQQHRANGFDYGLDNWLYGANGNSGGEVLSVLTGQKLNTRGRDFRFRPADGAFEAQPGETQYGRHRDDWGNWFGNHNSTWGWHFYLPEHYTARNPYLAVRTTRHEFAQYPDSTRVHFVSRKLQRFNDIGTQNYVTSCCSATPYRDDLFGPEFAHSIFICEPVYNTVHREVLEPDGVTFSSHRAPGEQDREFLASTDNWFRPVYLKTGPDGALYIADMYRFVIEHPEWIPRDTLQHLDLRAGQDLGRIYRVYPQGAKLRPTPRLDRRDTAGLVAALASPNGWERDTAQRLLVQSQARAAVAPLQSELKAGKPALAKARLQALGTLEGLGGLTPAVLLKALRDPHPAVRELAVRLTEPFLREINGALATGTRTQTGPLAAALLGLVNDPEIRVVYQLAFSLGEWHDSRAGRALVSIARRFGGQEAIETAVLSSAVPHVGEMLSALVTGPGSQTPPGPLFERLLGLAASLQDGQSLARGLAAALRLDPARDGALQFNSLASLFEAMDRQSLGAGPSRELPALPDASTQCQPVFARARQVAGDARADLATRVAAARLLGHDSGTATSDFASLGDLLRPDQPSQLQQAALGSLKRRRGAGVAEVLLAGWKTYSPGLRAGVLEVLFGRPEWVAQLLSRMEAQAIGPHELTVIYEQKLLSYPDEKLRTRARALLAAVNSNRQAVVDAYRSVNQWPGDPARGAALFQQNCALCHRLQGQGNAVGPDLAALTDKSIPAMLIAILDPNRGVEARFVSFTAVTKSEREVTGIIVSETANSLTLRSPGGAEEVLLRTDLAELTSSRLSLMPEGFENSLGPKEMADVIAYVNASGMPPKSFAGNHPVVVQPETDGTLRLLATTAEIYGDSLVFEEHYRNLGFWQSDNDRAIWSVDLPAAGSFDVWLDEAASSRRAENRYRLEAGGTRLVGTILRTGSWDDYRQIRLGRIDLPAGRQRVVFRGEPPLKGAIVDLRELRLVPAGHAAPPDFKAVRAAN